MSADAAASRARRINSPWRAAFLLYAAAMTVGLHWPQLRLAVGDVPAPDKIIHFTAFGGLIFLLWASGWVRSLLALWLIGLLWAFLAELTQSIPILGRSFSWWDIIAGWLGVTVVCLWVWAFGPIGGEANRLRLRMNRFTLEEVFTTWRAWIFTAIAGGAIGVITGVCATWLLWFLDPLTPERALKGGFVGALLGGLVGAATAVDSMVRRNIDRIAERSPCFRCGFSLRQVNVDDDGWGACPACGERFHLGQWNLRLELPNWSIVKGVWSAGVVAIWLATAAAFLYMALTITHRYMPHLIEGVVQRHIMPRDMRLTVDLAVLGIILAPAVRSFRSGVARIMAKQTQLCRVCSHDVHATPVERGLGRCGECGTLFVKV